MAAIKTAPENLDTVVEDGRENLGRANAGLALSGLAAGFNISFSALATVAPSNAAVLVAPTRCPYPFWIKRRLA